MQSHGWTGHSKGRHMRVEITHTRHGCWRLGARAHARSEMMYCITIMHYK